MPKASKKKFSLQASWSPIAAQFKGLNTSDPPSWPIAPRLTLCFALMVGIVAALWLLVISASDEELQAEYAKEVTLKADYTKKLAQAVNLEGLRKQREEVHQYVTQ